MKLLLDMNLSSALRDLLIDDGWECSHWSEIGNPTAPDTEIMNWARTEDRVIVTHDLDFGALLAITNADGPSVIQIRTHNVAPDHIAPILTAALRQFESVLEDGALVVVHEGRQRARILPLKQSSADRQG